MRRCIDASLLLVSSCSYLRALRLSQSLRIGRLLSDGLVLPALCSLSWSLMQTNCTYDLRSSESLREFCLFLHVLVVEFRRSSWVFCYPEYGFVAAFSLRGWARPLPLKDIRLRFLNDLFVFCDSCSALIKSRPASSLSDFGNHRTRSWLYAEDQAGHSWSSRSHL